MRHAGMSQALRQHRSHRLPSHCRTYLTDASPGPGVSQGSSGTHAWLTVSGPAHTRPALHVRRMTITPGVVHVALHGVAVSHSFQSESASEKLD
jgi:hypothetical protein